MTLILIAQTIASNDFYPLWLERLFRHLPNATQSIHNLLLFLSNSAALLATFGIPYLHYKLYGCDEENDTDPREKYLQMMNGLDTFWDQYSNFLLPILPALFPMVATSGVPACSSASFAATITFTVGAAGVATRIIFRVKDKVLQSDHAANEWVKASKKSWPKVPNKSFWILTSLPTVIFFWWIGLLISTVMLTFWERSVTGMTTSSEMQGCSIERLQAFKYALVATLAATATHFIFIIVKLDRMAAIETNTAVV